MSSILETKMDMETRLSTLWVTVMFYMLTIDILGLFIPGAQEEVLKTAGETPVAQLMLGAAIMMALPITMIFLSRVLRQGVNRWANIVVGVITIAFVVGGYSAQPHYYFMGVLEVLSLLVIIWSAWKWRK